MMAINLFRPVGLYELEKMARSGFHGFPPRLPQQPVFYPVLHRQYAIQIAQKWNTEDSYSGYCGFVTSFHVDAAFLSAYEVHQAGGPLHQEYWIPAEKLEEFNAHVTGPIQITDAFYGDRYRGAKIDFRGIIPEQQDHLLKQLFPAKSSSSPGGIPGQRKSNP